MDGYDARTYGQRWAPYYDDLHPEADDSVVPFLADYAGTPPRALELAIGSGRIAIPLARSGVDVSGIDISEEMVAKMRTKPGGEAIDVSMGDFADVDVDGTFPLVYLAFNTLFGLLTQQRQVECFENVARHLVPGGCFIIDCFVPDLKRFDKYNTRMGVTRLDAVDEHMYEMTIFDPTNQRLSTHHVKRKADGETVILPVEVRFAWPSEIDLMARLAGLDLEDRFGWYDRRDYSAQSTNHLSVYRKPG